MRPLLARAAVGTAAGVVGALVVYAIARAASGALVVTPPGQATTEIGAAPVVVATVVGGLIGLVLALVAARTPRPRTVFLAVGVVGTLVSFASPFSSAEETSTALWLNVMHVVVAVAVLGALATVLPERRAGAVQRGRA